MPLQASSTPETGAQRGWKRKQPGITPGMNEREKLVLEIRSLPSSFRSPSRPARLGYTCLYAYASHDRRKGKKQREPTILIPKHSTDFHSLCTHTPATCAINHQAQGFLTSVLFSGAPDCRSCLRPVPFTPSCTTQLPTTTLPTSRCFARSFARFLGRQIDRFHASDAHYESDIRMQTSMRTLYSAFLHVLLF